MRSGRSRENGKRGATFSPGRIATRVAELGRQISRACAGKRLDVVITLDRGFVFGADLIRHIDAPTVCHFIREDVRDVEQGGHARREVAFGRGPDVKGRDVLLVDAVLESGVTQEFLLRRIGESQPSWRKPAEVLAHGGLAGQAGTASREPGARLLWVPDCI